MPAPATRRRHLSLVQGVPEATDGSETLRLHASDLPDFRPATTSSSRSKSSSGDSRRGYWVGTIRTNVEALAERIGNVAVSAGEMLDALNAQGLNIHKVRKANGIGDAMGVVGLNLPVIEGCGRKLYLLLPLMMEAQEFEALAADTQALARYIAEKNKELQAKPAPATEGDQAEAA